MYLGGRGRGWRSFKVSSEINILEQVREHGHLLDEPHSTPGSKIGKEMKTPERGDERTPVLLTWRRMGRRLEADARSIRSSSRREPRQQQRARGGEGGARRLWLRSGMGHGGESDTRERRVGGSYRTVKMDHTV